MVAMVMMRLLLGGVGVLWMQASHEVRAVRWHCVGRGAEKEGRVIEVVRVLGRFTMLHGPLPVHVHRSLEGGHDVSDAPA